MTKIKLKNDGAELYLDALKKKYESQIAEAVANLNIYFNKSVGIGEHSDLLTEFDTWIGKLADASDRLETLEKFVENENNKKDI